MSDFHSARSAQDVAKSYPIAEHSHVKGTWSGGINGWLFTVDHKRLGILYISSGLVFFLVAGIMAALIRIQLAIPRNDFLDPASYNRMFTMHGTTMVFLVGMPIISGMANYLVPLMVGARDMAFPRLNAFGFWMFLFGGLLLYFSYLGGPGLYGAGSAPDVGWFAYAPLTAKAFSKGTSTDYWILGIALTGIGSIATAINIVVTAFCLRCRGMTLMRMPLFVWLAVVMAFLMILALPPLTAAQIMLLMDRYLDAKFFDTQAGGSAVIWQHFFWIFGHPEVYILIMPGFGVVNEIIPVFSRKPMFGYPVMVAASLAIAFLSLGVWAHHMFTVGMNPISNIFFASITMVIAVPTGIKIFNWIATMWGGKIRMRTPMLFSIAFLFQFLISGLTGIMLGVAPFDWQLHDSYFVVAHFHYVLIGGLLFAIFAAVYFWFPKVFGRMLSETLGKWHFWTFTFGFNLTFAPQHIAGFLGMPRRVYTYDAGRGWELWNMLSTIGVLFQAIGVMFFLWNMVWAAWKGRIAGDDPWDAWTLEWATTSPPPDYNFDVTPIVRSRRPLWDLKHPNDPDWRFDDEEKMINS